MMKGGTKVLLRDVMSRDVVCVHAELAIETLVEFLLERDLTGVPVIDRDRRLVGYIAMIDIVREHRDRGDERPPDHVAWGLHTEDAPRTVAEVMTPVAFELQDTCSIELAVEVMTSRQLHRVPVVSNEGVLVGIVTVGDLLRFFAHTGAPMTNERATEADRVVSLGFLASGLAHQVSNAMTPMRLSLGRLTSFELSRRPMSPERMHRIELLQDMREGLERIERIVRELKTFSHCDDAPSRPIEVSDVLEAALGLADHEIKHRARLVRNFGVTPRVNARLTDLRQIFLNLLINAVHATPEGEAHVHEIRVTTSTDAQGRAIVEVVDTGSGIPPEALSRIFEPFFTTNPGRALGLGLAVTRDLVTRIGGEIVVDSIVGQGTKIRLVLPACREDAKTVEPPVEKRRAYVRDRLRILIVDDDRPVAAAIALELRDHDVVVAENGREALEILRRDKAFDVILCDLMMPEISGMDVYESLRLIEPALVERVVLMTGGAFTHRAGEFLAEVEAPLLEKPFAPGQLHAVVNAIDHRRAPTDPSVIAVNEAWEPATHDKESS